MKPKLSLHITDTSSTQFWIDLLSQRYDLVMDPISPHYLIFGDRNFGQNNLHYMNATRIFYTGENERPYNYKHDFSISFDHDSETNYRFPGYAATPYWYSKYPKDTILKSHTIKYPKDRFCLFVHRNGSCHVRNYFFQLLNRYKKVDAAGPLFHNVDFSIGAEYDEKIELAKRYKFVLAFENGGYPGYVTEKIMDGFYAGAVPIYWGSYKVQEDFNAKSFINAHNWIQHNDDNLQEGLSNVLDRIIKVDQNDTLYNEYLEQPKLIDNKLTPVFDQDRLLDWWESTVMKDV